MKSTKPVETRKFVRQERLQDENNICTNLEDQNILTEGRFEDEKD
jgi:hypothetical protein